MKASFARSVPLALAAALIAGTALDIALHAPPIGWVLGGLLLGAASAAAVQGTRSSLPSWHRASRALLAVAFVGERLFAAGIDPVPMIGFLVLLMALASLQGLERTFAPVYDSVRDVSLVRKVDAAAVRAYGRALGLLGFTFVTSLLLALIVPLAVFQSRSLVVALGLALALLLVIGWLALSPALPARRRA